MLVEYDLSTLRISPSIRLYTQTTTSTICQDSSTPPEAAAFCATSSSTEVTNAPPFLTRWKSKPTSSASRAMARCMHPYPSTTRPLYPQGSNPPPEYPATTTSPSPSDTASSTAPSPTQTDRRRPPSQPASSSRPYSRTSASLHWSYAKCPRPGEQLTNPPRQRIQTGQDNEY